MCSSRPQATLSVPSTEPGCEAQCDTSCHCTLSTEPGDRCLTHWHQRGPELPPCVKFVCSGAVLKPLLWGLSHHSQLPVTSHVLFVLQTAEGTQKLVFPNLKELISTFEKPDQGLVVPLLKAVERSRPCLRWRRSTIELDGTYGKSCHSCGSKGTFIPLPPVHTADSTQMSFSAEVAPR